MEGTGWGLSHSGLGTGHNGLGPSPMNDPRLEGAVGYHGASNSNSPGLHPNSTPEVANYFYRPPGGGGEGEVVRSRRSFTETDEELTEEESSPQKCESAAKKQWDFKSSKSVKGGVSSRRQSLERRSSSLRAAVSSAGGTRTPKSSQDGGVMVGGGASPSLQPFRNGGIYGGGGPTLDPDNAAKAGSDVASEEDETLYKKAIMESARFQQQLKAIADSGSSDPDSDIEPPCSAYGVQVDPRYMGAHRLYPGGGPTMVMMGGGAGGANPYLYNRGLLEPRVVVVQQRPPGGPGPLEYHQEEAVMLKRHAGEKDFGFSVANAEGGGVFVKGLRPGGPAQLSRRLQPLDRIVQINGVSMRDSDCDTLLPLLRDTGSRVELVVIRSGLYSNDNRRHL